MRNLGSLGFTLLTALFISVGASQAAPVCTVESKIGKHLNLPVYEWVDESRPRKGIIVAVHGLTFYAAAYDKLARYLATNGYAVYAADLRGFGRWKTDFKKFGGDDQIHFTQSKEDLLRLVAQLRAENPSARIICLGESLGANYALWALSDQQGHTFDAAVLFAPGVKTRIHPHPRMAIDFFRGLRHPNKRLDMEPYITPYLSHDQNVTRACLTDRSICRRLSPVELIKAHITNRRAIEHVENIPADKPIMIVAGNEDQIFKTAALPEFAKRLGSRQVNIQTMPGKGHLLLEAQEVDADIRDAVDIWLATTGNAAGEADGAVWRANSATAEAANGSGTIISHGARPIKMPPITMLPAWLQTSVKRYSPIAMARASLQHAMSWTRPQ